MKALETLKELIHEQIYGKYNGQIDSLHTKAQNSEVTNTESCQDAIDLYIEIRKIESLVEITRKAIKNPYWQAISYLDDTAKRISDKLNKIKAILYEQISEYCLGNEENIISPLGTAKIQKEINWFIYDHTKLPSEIIGARESHIKQAIKPKINELIQAGVTSISGIMFSEEECVRISANRKKNGGSNE